VNAEAKFRHGITVQLLERAAAAGCLTTAERLVAAAWALVGDDEREDAGR
jgi:hypothetical protein